ncbi:PH domain-containing protein [Chitinophaga costaii]|uniref:PH domain-containing protein n=1 Tax=Chitinophaga costaii TaxID=1335309 RepID=A0A1C4FV78_9BACT|nr:PH domain-containing protein [Chitinophaga costaii]PUZ27251.1 hypothetical protein DCM91_08555 [Chitinophaga costaii]SCC59927.1 PH domain-containing protein [Chitinophaga costaii]
MRYNLSFDPVVKILTNIIILLALGLLGLQTFARFAGAGGWLSLGILVLAIFVSWGLHPQYYFVSDRSIIIQRPFRNIRIPLHTVIHVRPIVGGELGVNYRRFGIGGLFGYMGSYKSSRIGRYQMWATNRDSLVVIETEKYKYIVSPDLPLHFTNDINSRRYQQ